MPGLSLGEGFYGQEDLNILEDTRANMKEPGGGRKDPASKRVLFWQVWIHIGRERKKRNMSAGGLTGTQALPGADITYRLPRFATTFCV